MRLSAECPLRVRVDYCLRVRYPNALSPMSVLIENAPWTRRIARESHESFLVDGNGIHGEDNDASVLCSYLLFCATLLPAIYTHTFHNALAHSLSPTRRIYAELE